MKIGLVNEYFPPFAPGGAEWSMLALARRLAHSHHVTVITPNYGAAGFEEMDGIRVYRFNYGARIEAGQTTVRFRWLANPLFYLHSARQIERLARHERLDILHAQNKYSLPGTWLAARRLGLSVLYTVRDTTMICPLGQCLIRYQPLHPNCGHWGHWWRDCRPAYIDNYLSGARRSLRVNATLVWLWLDTRLRRWFFRRADGVIGVSEGILNVHNQAGLLTGQPTRVVYNLPPDDDPMPDDAIPVLRHQWELNGKKVVFYAGRFSPGKGTQDLVTAADVVVQRVPEALFLFAGQGNLTLSGPHTRSLGRLLHDEVWQLYHLADLVIVPSRQPEPLSRVALEAMAAGKPLVGTHVGGMPELIEEGVNGYLVERGNPAQLAEAITSLLLDDDLRTRMGQASLELVQTRFAPQTSLERLVDFYRQAIAGRDGRGRR
jgi:glycosyltransferase involved in cell wall biosynthesis